MQLSRNFINKQTVKKGRTREQQNFSKIWYNASCIPAPLYHRPPIYFIFHFKLNCFCFYFVKINFNIPNRNWTFLCVDERRKKIKTRVRIQHKRLVLLPQFLSFYFFISCLYTMNSVHRNVHLDKHQHERAGKAKAIKSKMEKVPIPKLQN